MTSVTAVPAMVDRPLRRDAERNRQVILEAARAVISEQGLDAGFDEIARRAGVGVATVYRRFPDREDLVEALFSERIGEVVRLAEEAAAVQDSWNGLVWFLERLIHVQACDRGLREVLSSGARGHERIAEARDRLVPAVHHVLSRSQDTGGVRRDVEVLDLAALCAVVSLMSTPESPELWRRYLGLMLDGLRPARPGATPLPEVPPQEIEGFISGGVGGVRRSARRR